MKPPYTEPYVRWCERSGVSHPLLLDYSEDFSEVTDIPGEVPDISGKVTDIPEEAPNSINQTYLPRIRSTLPPYPSPKIFK